MHPTDQHGAFQLLSQTLPDIARLPHPVIRNIADCALREAQALHPGESAGIQDDVPSPTQKQLGSEKLSVSVSKSSQSPSQVRRAPGVLPNDMLPLTSNKLSGPRKKRTRTSNLLSPHFDPSEGASLSRPSSFLVSRPRERFCHIGGISSTLDLIRELVEWPLSRSYLYDQLGVDPPRGILLHGPSGCGKTLLANAIAGELNVPFLRLSAPEIVSGVSGESERKLRDLFSEAVRVQPSIIFIDEIDAIASRREGASKDMERRIVSQLLTCIDQLSSTPQLYSSNVLRDRTAEPNISDSSTQVANTNGSFPQTECSDSANDEEMNQNDGKTRRSTVIVIAATNRPESLEPALRRAGRLDKEIELGAPDQLGRRAILSNLCGRLKLDVSVDIDILASRTAGYVGADLQLLSKEAGLACIRRIMQSSPTLNDCSDALSGSLNVSLNPGTPTDAESKDMDVERVEGSFEPPSQRQENYTEDVGGKFNSDYAIAMVDFESGLRQIQPSALREGFATRPNISWANVGALEAVREEMMMAIVEPIRSPEMFKSLGLDAASGVLLYGPPGCGKTLLARAVASESGANFISVKGPELLSKYVGDSELAVRKVFSRARYSAPCIIFFDELDALAPRRGGNSAGDSSGASERVVNMLLTEMDGFSERKQVFLIAATNRPDMIDPAMLRPGRLDKLVFVPLPDQAGRTSILRTLLRGVRLDPDVDAKSICSDSRCDGFSGADLKALIRVAGEYALKERLRAKTEQGTSQGRGDAGLRIGRQHFELALNAVAPSVSTRDAKQYHNMKQWLRKASGSVMKTEMPEK